MNYIELFEKIDKNQIDKFRHKNWKKGRYVKVDGTHFITNKGKYFYFPKINGYNDIICNQWEEYIDPVLTDWEKDHLEQSLCLYRHEGGYIVRAATDEQADFDVFIIYSINDDSVEIGRITLPKSDHFRKMLVNKKYYWKDLGLYTRK